MFNKKIILFLLFLFLMISIYPKSNFFIQNLLGDLIKVDVESGLKAKHSKLKGPRIDEIPLEFSISDFEDNVLAKLENNNDKDYLNTIYKKVNDKYIIDEKIGENIKKLKILYGIFISYNLGITFPKSMTKSILQNNVLKKINDSDKEFIKNIYIYDIKSNTFIISIPLNDPEKLRMIFMNLNKDNEMSTGLDEHGAPSPHNFPRVFEAKSKSHFDIHFVWGVKFDPIKSNGVEIGYVTLSFAFNLTNIVMPSLEVVQVKYNFMLFDKNNLQYPVEPYIGGALYGGFLDGFPIGFNLIGGCDIFPMIYENRADNKNFFLTGELRLGMVLYSKTYYDTGLNNEGIWKKLSLLFEGGFYFGYGYIFENNL